MYRSLPTLWLRRLVHGRRLLHGLMLLIVRLRRRWTGLYRLLLINWLLRSDDLLLWHWLLRRPILRLCSLRMLLLRLLEMLLLRLLL
jgi:hypothetical protein